MAHDNSIREEAVAWAVRTSDPAFADWDSFTQWLERNPAHAEIYDAVMADVDEAAEALPAVPLAANDEVIPPRQTIASRRGWLAGGMVMALAALCGIGLWQMSGGPRVIETDPGETRIVTVDDGSRIALGGDSAIRLDSSNPRLVTLERGQALFTITHDETRPFEVAVGTDRLLDIGTVFDVRLDNARMSVAVSEGAVQFNPDEQKVNVTPGHILTSAIGDSAYRLAAIPPAQVGEWLQGRLTFNDALLSDVAADLTRATGQKFDVSPAMMTRRISGSVLTAPVKADPKSLGPLLGVTITPTVEGWSIEAP
ncbi:iron dicitrate transport regulator FecR [Altererythrobacter indicus]|uniref:Iron dicitrate transport regulator FecR n=1 Tax=Altericroceibacterium indicum TaxID=374177 RepID=A0A845AD00_9SPHN|nr:FecR domain-containing protein [Altericroceibacterium indicum]MXP27123.1 iron dicitrate transport regulator FecR [Altericroceibacterium indicum]